MTHAKLQTLAQNGLSQAGETARDPRPRNSVQRLQQTAGISFWYVMEHNVCVCVLHQSALKGSATKRRRQNQNI